MSSPKTHKTIPQKIPTTVGIKVCGMKYNTQEVAALQPDYLGFIFYDKSPRDFEGQAIPQLPNDIKKVGVFVDADIAFVLDKIKTYDLDVVQLHGDEFPKYIKELNERNVISSAVEIWKVFSIKDHFNFDSLKPYEGIVDAFLFDTKGKAKGGNGYTFDWNVLKDYPSQTPFVLSGGIGLEEVNNIQEILATDLPILALDVNSKFEIKSGYKSIQKLQEFQHFLEKNNRKIQTTSAKAEVLLKEEQFYFYITTNTYNKILYTGFTIDLIKRMEEHTNKTYKSSFTAKYNLDKLVYFETFKTVNEARKREKQVKKWNREWKENLVNDKNPDWKDLQWML